MEFAEIGVKTVTGWKGDNSRIPASARNSWSSSYHDWPLLVWLEQHSIREYKFYISVKISH
jgi:hypothetical protein